MSLRTIGWLAPLALSLSFFGCKQDQHTVEESAEPAEASAAADEEPPGSAEDNAAFQAPGPCEVVHYEGGKETPNYRTRLVFNATGQPVAVEKEVPGDGGGESTPVSYEIKSSRLISRTDDRTGDGEPDLELHFEYDDAGHCVTQKFDHGVNGEFNIVRRYEYDDQGRPIRRLQFHDDADTPARIHTFEWDKDGNLVATKRDKDGDGEPDDRLITYTYDGRGNQIEVVSDYDGDGEPDTRIVKEYDAEGRRTLDKRDERPVGSFDMVEKTAYENDGRVEISTVDGILDPMNPENSEAPDGEPESIKRSEYDEHGNVTRLERDKDADGEPDDVYITTYEYDDAGQLTKKTQKDTAGTVRSVTEYSYGCWAESGLSSPDDLVIPAAEFDALYNSRGPRYSPCEIDY